MDTIEDEGFVLLPNNEVTPIYDVLLRTQEMTNWESPYAHADDVYKRDDLNQNFTLWHDVTTEVGLLANVTSPAHKSSNRSFYKEEQIGFLVFLFTGIFVGNVAVLLAIALSKRGRKSRMTFFIMHLAIADLLVGCVSVLTDLIWKVTVYWYAGNVMCHIVRYLQGVAMFASTYVLVALSIDRLEAIARPMSFTRSQVRARILVTVAWVLSALMALPLLILFKEMGPPGRAQCGMKLPGLHYWKLYVTLLATCLFLIPTVIISICYIVIIYVIWSKSKMLSGSSRMTKSAPFIKRFSTRNIKHDSANGDSERTRSGRQSQTDSKSSSRGVIPQAKIRTVKLTLVIVIVFIICWSPYFIFNLLDVYGHIPRSPSKRAITILIGSFAPFNSLANPLIYGLFSSTLFKYLRRIRAINWVVTKLCCCCPCSQQRLDPTGSVYLSTQHTYANTHSVIDDAGRRHRRNSTRNTYVVDSSYHSNRHTSSNGKHSDDLQMKSLANGGGGRRERDSSSVVVSET